MPEISKSQVKVLPFHIPLLAKGVLALNENKLRVGKSIKKFFPHELFDEGLMDGKLVVGLREFADRRDHPC